MTYIVRSYRGQEYVEDTETSQTRAIAIAKARKAEGYTQVVLIWPGTTPDLMIGRF